MECARASVNDIVAFKASGYVGSYGIACGMTCDSIDVDTNYAYTFGLVCGIVGDSIHVDILPTLPSTYPLQPPRFGPPSGQILTFTLHREDKKYKTPLGLELKFYQHARKTT